MNRRLFSFRASRAALIALAVCLPALPVFNAFAEEPRYAILAGKIITCAERPIDNGVILVSGGKIEALGPRGEIKIPEGYKTLDYGAEFAMPGLVEAHSHTGSRSGDLNEMVYQTNPEMRVIDQIQPYNDSLKVAVAGGVTTICGIPGSGTNMGGWGVLMKTGPGTPEDVVIRFPGVLKIAQSGNPERRTSGELGSGRRGMNWLIREQLRAGKEYNRKWLDFEEGRTSEEPDVDLRLEYFKPLFRREIPVVVHTQAYQVIQSTLRILHDEMGLSVVIDHGTFDSYEISEEIIKRGIPVMAGPRGFYYDRDVGQLFGIPAEYSKRGISSLGVNTDSPVIPQEELLFQASMAVRYGWNEEAAVRGITIEPAKALMVDDRVGSLEPGKDADIVITEGLIIDPSARVVMTMIDGRVIYDVEKDRQRF